MYSCLKEFICHDRPFDHKDLPETFTFEKFCTETGTIKIPCDQSENKRFILCIFGPVTQKQLETIHRMNKDLVGFTLHYYFEYDKFKTTNHQRHLSLLKDLKENGLLKA